MNSLYQQMMGNQLPNNMQRILQMANMFANSNNPQQLITNMINQNPKLKQTMDLIQNSGKSPKDLFYEMARQNGMN